MDTNTQNKTLREKFELLPEAIRDWLTSERATYITVDINKRFNVPRYALPSIAELITRLAVGDIHPTEIIQELAFDMELSSSAAETLYHEVEEKLLKPIADDLKKIDIDIHLAKIAPATTQAPSAPLETLMPAQNPIRINVNKPIPPNPALFRENQNVTSEKPSTTEEPHEDAAPFILHEERSAFTPATPKIQSSVNFDILRAPRVAAQKPITAKVETPSNTFIPKAQQEERVVHYSNLRTPLDVDGNEKK
jgi:hypothetical protein